MHRVLIAGYGSIGARHGRLLAEMGADVACVTRNRNCPFPIHADLATAVQAFTPSHVLIANATADHAPTLAALRATGWRGPVLIEKPLFDQPVDPGDAAGFRFSVAYNLRFHPLVAELRRHVGRQHWFSASFHVGQYLPDWRPGTDYRLAYSASRARGGGVLRDLTHEIDLAVLFCGGMRRIAALGGQISDLEIDSDDVFHLLGQAERCPVVSIELNYLNRTPRRVLCLNGPGRTVVLDFIAGTLDIDGQRIEAKPERDVTYIAQLEAFLGGSRAGELCTLAEGMAVDAIVDAADRAAREGVWVTIA